MRILTLGAFCLFCAVALVGQTHDAPPAPQPAQDGGVRAVLESIVIPPIPNHPFSATLDTEWVQYAGEGGTIPATACIISAIEDALSPFGVVISEHPISPQRVTELLDAAQEACAA